jgi:CRP-like cAMP-binding protein
LKALIRELEIELYSEGDIIMKEGSEGSNMIFLLHGCVDVFSNGEKIATLGAGNLFGEMVGLGLSRTRTCTIVANEFCDCRCITAYAFKAVLNRFPEAKARFASIAEDRKAVLNQASQMQKMDAWLNRSRMRRAKRCVELEGVPGRERHASRGLHEKQFMASFGSKVKQSCPALLDRRSSHASLLAAGWNLDLNEGLDETQESTTSKHTGHHGLEVEIDSEEVRDDDAELDMIRQELQDSPVAAHCRKPMAPAHASPEISGSSFRKGRLLKQASMEASMESAETTAPPSRSASLERTSQGEEDAWLPAVSPAVSWSSAAKCQLLTSTQAESEHADEHALHPTVPASRSPYSRGKLSPMQAPQSLKDVIKTKNSVLRQQLVKTRDEVQCRMRVREELLHGHSPKPHSIDLASLGSPKVLSAR